MNLRDIILSAPDLKREAVEVPEWQTPDGKPVTVHVSEMNGHERSAWSAEAFDDEGKVVTAAIRSRLLVHCLTDEAGTPIFSAADIDALEKKNPTTLTRLFEVAKRLNGLGVEAVEDAKKN
jgi:hypothetical protein